MQPVGKFLLKVLGCSLLLFLVWPPVAGGYGDLLAGLLAHFSPGRPPLLPKWPYAASVFLIPLISLVVATPRLAWGRKAGIIGCGAGLSLLLDLGKILLDLGDHGQRMVGYTIYHGLKWQLPLLLWLLPASPVLQAFFKKERAMEPSGYHCPLCGEEQVEVLAHLQARHGSRSLRYKKVRKFINRHCGGGMPGVTIVPTSPGAEAPGEVGTIVTAALGSQSRRRQSSPCPHLPSTVSSSNRVLNSP